MSLTRFNTTHNPNFVRYQELFTIDPKHPHVHLVDMPFRITSTWQDQGCEFGVWEKDNTMLAWAVFQPPWRNLDYAIRPSERGSALEKELVAWGKEQMQAYAERTGEGFSACLEFFADTPHVERTIAHLHELGFEELEESTLRFELDLRQTFPPYHLPDNYVIRPLGGKTDIQDYVHLVETVFTPHWMTPAWRRRTLEHPAYLRELDFVVANSEDMLVGFCSSWHWQDIGQIEPLGVHPDYRGIGLGNALELAVIGAMQHQGARFLYVDHGSSNEKAIALSRKNGFRQRNNVRRYSVECLPKGKPEEQDRRSTDAKRTKADET